MPWSLTLTLSKREVKSKEKTEADAHAFLWVDADVAVGPIGQGELVPDPSPPPHLGWGTAVVSWTARPSFCPVLLWGAQLELMVESPSVSS